MISDIFRTLGNWLGLGMPPGQPLSLGFQISNFLAKLYISIFIISKNFRTIPSVGSEMKFRQNFSGFGHTCGPALVRHFEF